MTLLESVKENRASKGQGSTHEPHPVHLVLSIQIAIIYSLFLYNGNCILGLPFFTLF